MYNLKKHYKKLVKYNEKSILALSPEEILQLYLPLDDCFDIGTEKSLTVPSLFSQELETINVVLTGKYRCLHGCVYSFTNKSGETVFIYEKQDGTSFIDLDILIRKIIQTLTYIKQKSIRTRTSCLLSIAILLLVASPFLIKDSPIINNGLIKYSNVGTQLSSEKVYDKIKDSVVLIKIYSDDGETSATASGIIVREDGFLISCAHIYSNIYNPKFKVIFHDGRSYDSIFVSGDVESDTCILKIVNTNDVFKSASFANSNDIVHGETVYTVGFPGGTTIDPIISAGIISATDVRQANLGGYQNSYIQTDATANPGSSGGALLNNKGQVIGMITSKIAATNYENTVYSVPSKEIQNVVNELFSIGYIMRPTLGITFTTVQPHELDAGLPFGAKIATINDASNAKELLDVDEIVTKVDGKQLSYSYELYDAVQNLNINNKTITMEVYNSSSKQYRTISFEVFFRTSSSGYLIGTPPTNNEGQTN